MTYKDGDWQRVFRRLQSARTQYEEYKALDAKSRLPDLLDDAVTNLWTFGEYAINVRLESLGQDPPQDHSQSEKAGVLYLEGSLAKDYSKTLTLLEAFRKKGSHLGYTKERSTHYSSADVLHCLEDMELLRSELEDFIKEWKRRP